MSNFSDFYKIVTDLINSAQNRGGDIIGNINQMSLDLDNSEIRSDEIERQRLDTQINATYTILSTMHSEQISRMLKIVFKLQQYVDNTYPLVNNFLRDEGLQVKQIFADMSKLVGYPIDSENIEGTS